MSFFKKILNNYKGALRSFRIVYVINNLFYRKKLKHNKSLYKKFGIEKSIFSSIGKEDLLDVKGNLPWLDEEGAMDQLLTDDTFKSFDPAMQANIKNFVNEGFMVLKSFYSEEEVEEHNREIEKLLESGKLFFNYTSKKIMEAYKESDLINKKFFRNPTLIRLFDFLLGKKTIPFHTINFIEGSEQKAHSDSIHMSTEPEGYLLAAWTALEPTDPNNGPLFYYPGSHKLPYVSCLDYESGNSIFRVGGKYKAYEKKIQDLIEEKGLKKSYFFAEPGDVFIWHANLIHGGDAIKEAGRTRKSMVAHYFFEDVICYHEISQRPALIETEDL